MRRVACAIVAILALAGSYAALGYWWWHPTASLPKVVTPAPTPIANVMWGFRGSSPRFLELVRQKRAVMLCCRQWLGIYEMTIKIGKATETAVLPIDEHELQQPGGYRRLLAFLKYHRVTALIVHGIPFGTMAMVRFLHEHTHVNVAFVYHSGVAVHNVATEEAGMLGKLAQAAADKLLTLVFIEHDQAIMFRHLGVPACAMPCTMSRPIAITAPPKPQLHKLRIGVMGTNIRPAVKNFFTQISAACMVHGAEVHVTALPPGPDKHWYLKMCAGKIIQHGHVSSDKFTELLGRMDINLYVSWTDAVPNVVGDSLSARVPVLTSDTTPWFDQAPNLRQLLVEPRIDDPSAIYNRILRVIAYVREFPDEFGSAVSDMLYQKHALAVLTWTCFAANLGTTPRGSPPSCPSRVSGKCKRLQPEQYNATHLALLDWRAVTQL